MLESNLIPRYDLKRVLGLSGQERGRDKGADPREQRPSAKRLDGAGLKRRCAKRTRKVKLDEKRGERGKRAWKRVEVQKEKKKKKKSRERKIRVRAHI